MPFRVSVCLLALSLIPIAAHATPWIPQNPEAPPPAMAADANPGYDVVTIKPTAPGEAKHTWVQGVRLSTANTSLADLMMFAYSIHDAQIVGGPDWMRTAKFDVLFQPNMPGRPSTLQMRSILRKVLADRFHLAFHHAQRELPVYSIVQAKGGSKLTPTSKESAAGNTASMGYSEGTMEVRDASIAEVASLMQRYMTMDRPIVDHSGLTGKYDFSLRWTPDIPQSGATPSAAIANGADAPPSFYTALQEQLGLRLEAKKEAIDVLLIDKAELPTEN